MASLQRVTSSLLPGLSARRVPTDRLTVNVVEVSGRTAGEPVVFVHGNVSSSLFWQHNLLDLAEGNGDSGGADRYRPLAVDLRGFGDTDPEPVDATRGVRDYSDDLAAVVDALDLGRVHLIGWSMGGGVVLQYLRDRPESVRSVTLVNPVSPYGFSGTRNADGLLCRPDGLGSGGGGANPDFVARLAAGDRGDESPTSPRNIMLATYFKPPFVPDLVEVYLDSMLSTRIGDDHYPGEAVAAEDWPGVLPGKRGVLNTMAPIHLRLDDLDRVDPKPPILWIRGSDDQIVSDTSLYDLAYLGSLGAVPGWPGEDTFPPQPMVTQTRAVLARYAEAGGSYREVVIADTGHSPHVEKPGEFTAVLREGLALGT